MMRFATGASAGACATISDKGSETSWFDGGVTVGLETACCADAGTASINARKKRQNRHTATAARFLFISSPLWRRLSPTVRNSSRSLLVAWFAGNQNCGRNYTPEQSRPVQKRKWSPIQASDLGDGWPIQARFWLEWGSSTASNIPILNFAENARFRMGHPLFGMPEGAP